MVRARSIPWMVLLLVGAAGALPAAERGRTPPIAVLVPGEKRTASIVAATSQVLDGVNRLRREKGIAPFVVNPELTQAARDFAAFMAESDQYGHEADGRSPSGRAAQAGYVACIVAENLAYQYLSTGFHTTELSQGFIEGWMDSAGHRANLLDPDVTETGLAIARSSRTSRYYAVQMFGRPRTLEVVFAIRSRMGRAIEYHLNEKTHPLPAGTTVTHRQCRPARLLFPGASRDTPAFTVGNGELYEVMAGAGNELEIGRTMR